MRLTSGLEGRGAYPAVALSGGALALAFPEPDLAPLAWVALVPLLLVLHRAGLRRGAALGGVFGIAFFAVLVYWISIVGYLAFALLLIDQTVFIALFGGLWGWLSRKLPDAPMSILGPAILWVAVAEYFRSLFPVRGFTWGQLAQSQHNVPHLLRVTGLGGSWLLAFVLVAVNALVAVALVRVLENRRKAGAVAAVAAVGLLLLPFLLPAAGSPGETIRVAIVQGNVPRDEPASFEKDLVILESHARLTASLDNVDLVVWPESAIGIDPFRHDFVGRKVSNAAVDVGAPMLVGGNQDLPANRYKVMVYLVTPDGRFADRYQKTHLVPFGEYVPGRRFLDWIPALDQVPRDAVPANKPTVFEVAGGRVAPVISFEGDFGSLVQQRIAEGGRLLVVATNTSTWGSSWASAQHVAMSQVRAAENGVPVVHAAISGISAFIDPQGHVLERSALWEEDVLVEQVAFAEEVTFYARTGDWMAFLCLQGALVLLLLGLWRFRSERTGAPGGGEGLSRT